MELLLLLFVIVAYFVTDYMGQNFSSDQLDLVISGLKYVVMLLISLLVVLLAVRRG